MNLKLAKKLRKIAKGLWQNSGAPSFEEYMKTQYTENAKNRKIQTTYETDADGNYVMETVDGSLSTSVQSPSSFRSNKYSTPKIKSQQVISDGTVSIVKTCFRGQYRSMKRAIAA